MTTQVTPVMAVRIAAFSFVILAIAATTIHLRQAGDKPPAPASTPTGAGFDPFRAELIRCQELGEAGARDPACLRAWADNRRRFLETSARPNSRVPVEMFPKAPNRTAGPSVSSMQPKEP
ncbi:MAG: putative entry exclusion protein TrbK-alt [Methylovirgula sp.]